MQIEIHCIGKLRDNSLQNIINEYLKRLKNKVIFKEIPSVAGQDIVKNKKAESLALLSSAKTGFKICLDEKGKHLNSLRFASLLQEAIREQSKVHFFIGGAYGHDQIMHENADFMLSLSSMTFPHQLVRMLIIEQIYRAMCISNNHPYHKL